MKMTRKNENVVKMYELYEIRLMNGYRFGVCKKREWLEETHVTLKDAKQRLKELEHLQDAGYFEWRDARICKVIETRQTVVRAESRAQND